MKYEYAKALTKDYLKFLGITDVDVNGNWVKKNDKEIALSTTNQGYKIVVLYDPIKYKLNYEHPYVGLGVHRIVYAWFNDEVPKGMVVDHIDCNKDNNALANLQLLTPAENLAKERGNSTRLKSCSLNKPRKFYEDRLDSVAKEYEVAKAAHDAEACHRLRSYKANYEANLRYYDLYIDEYLKKKTEREIKKDWYHELARLKRNVKDFVKYLKSIKGAWHPIAKFINQYKDSEENFKILKELNEAYLRVKEG